MKIPSSKKYLIPAIIGLILALGLPFYFLFCSVSTLEDTHYLYIDEDDTQDSVIAKIKPIASPTAMAGLQTLLRHAGYAEDIKTGRYAIKPGEGAVTIYRHLKNGLQESLRLTIPETRTMTRLASILGKKLMLDSARIASALYSQEVCGRYGYDTCTIPAMFVPNTYDIYWNVSLDGLLERMQKEHDRFWNGERTAKTTKIALTPNEVATLASIIDEETANTAEKPMIAGMYMNRLRQGMPLQADPTIKFALKEFGLKRIYNKLLKVDSPYNTYVNEGLPPGPIKIASIKGIDAVLNHVEHDYLYMCAKEDFSGTHNFAKTYSEHLQNAAKYTKALNERGIK
ncbi:MAG: endolytic transglycosylase MltG [Prevotella sp.]|nr:endolytic transglycosylase MltG [Prevotella sp.]